MTPETLHRIGTILHGPDFRSPLARGLGVSQRTVRRWASGAYPISPDRSEEIILYIAERSEMLAKLAEELAAQEKCDWQRKTA